MAEGKEDKKESLIGGLVIKLAGRDAGQVGVIVEEQKNNIVLIDGSVRRRKCNLKHLELLNKNVDIKTGASHSDVVSALKKLGITVVERKPKPKKEAPKEEKKAAKEKKKAEKKAKKETKKKVAKKN